MMEFITKLSVALVLLMFAVCISAAPASATDYSQTEDLGEKVLLDPQFGLKIKAVDVTIGTSRVIIDYVSTSSSAKELGEDIGAILGVYKMIIDEYPEAGDLSILARSNFAGTPTRFNCPKSWVSGLDFSNADAIGAVAEKVIETGNKG
jgi:hypothetical protein